MGYGATWEIGDDIISEIMFTRFDVITNLDEKTKPVSKISHYPNPAQDYINIEFESTVRQRIKVIISEFNGKHVKILVDREMPKGKQRINWHCKNENGIKVSSGLYLCRVYAGRNVMTKSLQIIN